MNGYAGQGESERMNKSVKATRTIKRNRQTHEVTAAYVELKNWFRMSDSLKRKATEVHQPYLRCVRDKIELARQLREEERAERELIATAAATIDEDEAAAEIGEEAEVDQYDDSSDDEVAEALLEE